MGIIPPNLRPDLDALRVDVAVAALRDVVKDGWSVLGLSTGMVDGFSDQSGIASLGGAGYDAAAKIIGNAVDQMVPQGAGSAIGSMTSQGGVGGAFNGATNQVWASSAIAVASTTGWVGKDWGAGVTKRISRYKVYASSDFGFDDHSANGSTQYFYLEGSSDGSTWVTLHSGSAQEANSAVMEGVPSTSPSYRYHRVRIVTAATSAGISQVQFYEQPIVAATVVSSAFALGFQPEAARIISPVELNGGVIGVDCTFQVSRDGVVWVAVPIADLGKFDNSTRILGGMVGFGPRPAGSSIYWRWRTSATYAMRNHGIWLQCK